MRSRRRLRAEILLVLSLTFGMSGVRSALRLLDALLNPTPLQQQQVTLNAPQSTSPWLDLALQLCSAAVLLAWGGLSLYLLRLDGHPIPRSRKGDFAIGVGLAALIGIPGLGLYLFSLHHGWTREVIPSAFHYAYLQIPILLLWSAANAIAEEFVVVHWLMTRLRECRWGTVAVVAACALLRGSYHLYQGISAGVGNLLMGIVFGALYARTGRVWPLVIAHFLIDAVAFVGYQTLGGLPWR